MHGGAIMNDDPMEDLADGKEQRRSERTSMKLQVTVSLGGTEYDAVLLNISGEGAKVQVSTLGESGAGPGAETRIDIPRFGPFEGTIIWTDDIFLGMEFDENHKATAGLIRAMAEASA